MTARHEWLLIALAHRRGEVMTPVQVQKAMFLMDAEAKQFVGEKFYQFVPYNYGPFDADVYNDLALLEREGLVASVPTDRGWKMFAATPAGVIAAAKVQQGADAKAVAYLQKVVDWVASLSFTALVRAIYEKYPKYKANSVFSG